MTQDPSGKGKPDGFAISQMEQLRERERERDKERKRETLPKQRCRREMKDKPVGCKIVGIGLLNHTHATSTPWSERACLAVSVKSNESSLLLFVSSSFEK